MKKFLISFVLLNTLIVSSSAKELKDCSNISKFSPAFYKCKSGNFIKESKNYQKKEWLDEKKKLDDAKKKVGDAKKKVLNK